MTEQPDYLDAAEAMLRHIEAACDRISDHSDTDIDVQRQGQLLTLRFAGGGHIVVNLQKPLREIWLATPHSAHHYRLQEGRWLDTRDGSALLDRLAHAASALAGCALCFA